MEIPSSRIEKLTRAEELARSGQLPAAEELCREVLATEPACADAHHLLGQILVASGNLAAATASLAQAVQTEPNRAEMHFALAMARFQARDYAGAAASYAEACRRRPGWIAALVNQGAALSRLQRYPEAAVVFREALRVAPDSQLVLTNLAGALQASGRHSEAADLSRRALLLAPDNPESLLILGDALHSLDRLVEAEAAYRQALALAPGYALAHYNLGHVLNDQWRAAEALARFREAVVLDPDYQPAWHALLFNLLYDPAQTEESIFEAHVRWGARLAVPARNPPAPVTAGDRPVTRIKVGYVSPDFRAHSCQSFLQPLFAGHDRSVVEVFAYSSVRDPDAYTDWFKAHAEHWRDIRGMDDAAIEGRVREDAVHILVDLAGHTRDQPLGVFARQPAPVQVAWLGYPATSGLRQIGFRLTDEQADPPGIADRFHSERLLRLPGGFLCYGAPDTAPGVSALPAAVNGYVTFGSFNNIAKVTPEVVQTWAAILRGQPGSRMLIKGRMLRHNEARMRLTSAFADAGIDPARLDMRDWIPFADSPLAAYHGIDIALDTFPYGGATTTFEALWMGVPVITLKSARHAGRVGASVLTQLGRFGWITTDKDAYVAAALRLSVDLPALAAERRTLRASLEGSSLMDAAGFARKIEAVYRALVDEATRTAPRN